MKQILQEAKRIQRATCFSRHESTLGHGQNNLKEVALLFKNTDLILLWDSLFCLCWPIWSASCSASRPAERPGWPACWPLGPPPSEPSKSVDESGSIAPKIIWQLLLPYKNFLVLKSAKRPRLTDGAAGVTDQKRKDKDERTWRLVIESNLWIRIASRRSHRHNHLPI